MDNNSEYQKREEEKLKKKREKESREKEHDVKIKIDTKNLLEELAQKIAKEFWVDVSEVKNLIWSKTLSSLEDLKFSVKDKENLLSVISGARDVIEKASRDEIDLLRWNIDKVAYDPEKNIYLSNKLISKRFMDRALNPKGLRDNLIWASVWLVNSAEQVVRVLYYIWTWVLKVPYHIYLIVTWRGKYEGFEKV